MIKYITIIMLCVMSFMIGNIVSGFNFYALAVDCSVIPAYHVYFLKQIKECLQESDYKLDERITLSNDYIFSEIERLDSKIDNSTRVSGR